MHHAATQHFQPAALPTDTATIANGTAASFTSVKTGLPVGQALSNQSVSGAVVSGGATANYAAADQVELGSPLANTPDFPATGGAHIGNGSYVGIADGTVAPLTSTT